MLSGKDDERCVGGCKEVVDSSSLEGGSSSFWHNGLSNYGIEVALNGTGGVG